jgi:transcriptional regulator with XRE-family HTH domain
MATFLLEVALGQERVKQRLSEWLSAERGRRHLTQQKMAEFLGASYRMYQRYEAGQSLPRWRHLEQMAEKLGTDLGHVLAIDEPLPTTDSESSSLQEGLEALRAEFAAFRDEVREYQQSQRASPQ